MKKSVPIQRSATMLDIASAAGVSQTTVSFVINDNFDVAIAQETRANVKRIAKELGYVPRIRRGKKTKSMHRPFLGLIVDDIYTSIFASVSIDAARDAADEIGYDLEIALTRNDPTYEVSILRRWVDQGVEGILYTSILTRGVSPPELLNTVPCVLLNCHDVEGVFTSILPAETMGGMAATQALIDSGCKRIAYLGGEDWVEAATKRCDGYRTALTSADIPINENLIDMDRFTMASGYERSKALLALPVPPDGIFCANDLIAIGAYHAASEKNLSIPDDIKIVGYDDQPFAREMNPGLTTVLLPHSEMGFLAVEVLSGIIRGAAPHQKILKIDCPLVMRGSC